MSNENPNNEARIGLSLLNAGLGIAEIKDEDFSEACRMVDEWRISSGVYGDSVFPEEIIKAILPVLLPQIFERRRRHGKQGDRNGMVTD